MNETAKALGRDSVDFHLEVRECFLYNKAFKLDLEEWEILRHVEIGEGSLGRELWKQSHSVGWVLRVSGSLCQRRGKVEK